MIDYIIFASYGNDSIALIQWAWERKLKNVIVAHNDTGWASKDWEARIERGRNWVDTLGFKYALIESIGLEALVRSRKGWPLPQKFKFCTTELKIKPARDWMETVDPECDTVCMVGVRRGESRARSQWPEWVEESDKHGGRSLWSPLVRYDTDQRDELVHRAGFEVLPHRSKECFPCIHANRRDLRQLTEERVAEIEQIEKDMGFTSKGKPRTMFRPYRHQGATGIREVWRWAKSERGEYGKKQLVILGEGTGCDSGMCGEG